MCLQCIAEAELIIEKVLKGDKYSYSLMRSTKDNEEWPKGWYGLVICNDPQFIFDAEILKDDDSDNFHQASTKLEEGIITTSNYSTTIARLYDDAKLNGYDKEQHGNHISSWLLNHLASKM